MPRHPTYKELKLRVKALEDEFSLQVKEQTKQLELKIKSLEELNRGLEVLLQKREKDKIEIEDSILANVKMLITPYLEKIKKTKLDEQQKVFIDIIESNINEIVSPFSRKMSIKELNLTPMEIQIANLIIQGASSKKIGKIIGISSRTVDTHRKNIRKKIGLDQKRANLRSFLLSLN
jgi:DNA-binding CsgD family transcriptional regulator